MSKYTPGPWFVSLSRHKNALPHIRNADGLYVMDAPARTSKTSGIVRQMADARLIALAPTMFDKLKELIDIEGPCPGTAKWADEVRALIAVVEGNE